MSLHLNRAATAAAFACCLWLAGCSRGPDLAADAPDYRELAVVLQARLAPCLNQPGFVPPWPRTDWRSDRKPVDYAHPAPIAATAGIGGVPAAHYLMHIGDGGYAVYVSQVAGAPPSAAAASAPGGVPAMPVQQVWGPLPFSAKCPEPAPAPAPAPGAAASAVPAASAPR